MPKFSTLLILLFGSAIGAHAQQLLMLGPLGKPVMVLDEGSNWSAPIQVYSDASVAYYTPDITSPGWLSWHVQDFRETGRYSVQITAWYKDDSVCLARATAAQRNSSKYHEMCKLLRYEQMLVSIDTRNKSITKLQSILMQGDARLNPLDVSWDRDGPKSLAEIPKRVANSVARINAILIPKMNEFKGITIQSALQGDRDTVARMAAASRNPQPGQTPTPPQRTSPSTVPSPAKGFDELLYKVGDSVAAPKVLLAPEAIYSEQARNAKLEGTVVVTTIVDRNGTPQKSHVSSSLGMGLDEKAVEAVKQYRFKPAINLETGQPVPVMVSVVVRFRLY